MEEAGSGHEDSSHNILTLDALQVLSSQVTLGCQCPCGYGRYVKVYIHIHIDDAMPIQSHSADVAFTVPYRQPYDQFRQFPGVEC
jgi:hypothetical protein